MPADGFFEWRVEGRRKWPHWVTLPDSEPFAFAAMWDRREGHDGPVEACVILTAEPNDIIRPLHHRMAVILDRAAFSQWLDPELRDAAAVGELLTHTLNDKLTLRPVSMAVNDVRNEGPKCIAPPPDEPKQRSLFDGL